MEEEEDKADSGRKAEEGATMSSSMAKYAVISGDADSASEMSEAPQVIIEDAEEEAAAAAGDSGDGTNDEDEELRTFAHDESDENLEDKIQETVFSMKNLEIPDQVSGDVRVASPEIAKKTLHQIARDGDVTYFEELPSARKDQLIIRIDKLDDKKLTPLHYAARYCNVDMTRLLLKYGPDVNKKGDDEMTPLHYVARYGKRSSSYATKSGLRRRCSTLSHSGNASPVMAQSSSRFSVMSTPRDSPNRDLRTDQVMEELINAGANINETDKYKMSALHHAAMRGNLIAIKRLLETSGIVKEPRDVQQSTPLHLAATYNHYEAAQVLLTHGQADPRCKDNDQRTPLHEACLEGNLDIADLLLREGEKRFGYKYVKSMLEDGDDAGATPLLLAVGSGKTDIVELLLKKKVDVNTPNEENVFPIHSAARTGDIETLKLLIKNNAKLNAINDLHQTPLFLAASCNHVDVINYLIENHAEVDKGDIEGQSPLMVAVNEGNADAVRTLIDRGASLDVFDIDDKSLLFHAAEKNRPEIIKILLETSTGRRLLEENDQYDNLPLHIACAKGNIECVELLIEAGADIDNKNEDEQTPLHLAAINGRPIICEILLKKDPNAVMDEDEDSNTALHLACTARKPRVVDILLNYGADVQSRNAKKWTPLDSAAAVGAYDCAQLLLKNDAPIDPVDRSKTTPLHLAAENGHERLILLLLDAGANMAMEDAYGRNLLELAIISRQKHVVKAILQHKDWRKAMRTSYTVKSKNGTLIPETPLRLLIKVYPDLAGMVFDKSITKVKDDKKKQKTRSSLLYDSNASVTMDYEFIDDAFNFQLDKSYSEMSKYVYCDINPHQDRPALYDEPYVSNGKVRMDNHPMMIMAQQKRKDLLRHPLCLALVRHKWKSFGRYVYYGSLSMYCLFLLFLTTYVLIAPNPINHPQFYDCYPENSSSIIQTNYFSQARQAIESGDEPFLDEPHKAAVEFTCQYGIFVLVAVNLIREVVQLIRVRGRYFQWTNLFDWIVYVMSFMLVLDIMDNAHTTGYRTCWQWEMGAAVVVLAWLNLLGDVRQLPFLGIYVIMFFDILKTFLRFAVIFLLFIVAFGLGFHLLLSDQVPFKEVGDSLIKTTVMMIGEFEYENIFYPEERGLPFPLTTYILFVTFLIVMSIIIMNLLVGLAVDDIKAVQEQAVLKRLAMQVEHILDVERLVPNFLLRRTTVMRDKIKRKKRFWWSIFTDVVSSRSIMKDIAGLREVIDVQDVLERQSIMEDSMRDLKRNVDTIAQESGQIKEVLYAIAEASGIQLDSGD